jgi:hypothetical protein
MIMSFQKGRPLYFRGLPFNSVASSAFQCELLCALCFFVWFPYSTWGTFVGGLPRNRTRPRRMGLDVARFVWEKIEMLTDEAFDPATVHSPRNHRL